MKNRKKPQDDNSGRVSTTEWARQIHQECIDVLHVLERDFGFQITESKHETAYVEMTAQSTLTFITISWDPRDGFMYWIGPIENGQTPSYPVHPNLNHLISNYEIAFVAAVKTGGILPTIRGKNNSTLESLSNAIAYLVENAADLLRGDWSCRAELEVIIRKNIGN